MAKKEVTTESVSKEEQKEWKDRILGINNGKLLDYICQLCDARRSLGRADDSLKEKKDKKNEFYPYTPEVMEPVTESDDPDENA